MTKRKYIDFNKPNQVQKLRIKMFKKGFELVDITSLCKVKVCNSGLCNGFNEANDNIYHVRVNYIKEIIANMSGSGINIIDEDRYIKYVEQDNFIIFKKCPIDNGGK